MLDSHLDLIDKLKILDNSIYRSTHILTFEEANFTHMNSDSLPVWIKANMPVLTSYISNG
ncbi:hypothetical protein FHS68_001552 [Dyadobacter arcticus]|uniref:Uncharacterized protein n=1 Tax=Dyadobacter arcticus TaxID=1078754 RepID=A0ABX0UH85_9BACT|nr:hypothetical protein [Dyadobacter arcticus]